MLSEADEGCDGREMEMLVQYEYQPGSSGYKYKWTGLGSRSGGQIAMYTSDVSQAPSKKASSPMRGGDEFPGFDSCDWRR